MNPIDVHTHGIGGLDTRTSDETVILALAAIHHQKGVSAFLPTVYPGPLETMRAHLAAIRKAMQTQAERGDSAVGQARIVGAHLEGPFLNPLFAGALNPLHFLECDEQTLELLIGGNEDVVKIVTVAPEIRGALDLIRRLSSRGVIVSMGHSNATFAEAEEGYRAGARGITHIFNAMRALHHREPGIAGFGLIHDSVYVEIITDCHHLHEETINLVFRVKDHRRILIVSDSVGSSPAMRDGRPVIDQTGRLLGGSLSITESAALLIERGLDAATARECITTNPARYLGLM